MHSVKSRILQFVFYVLLAGVVIALFWRFSFDNTERIRNLNREYAADEIYQIALRLSDQFQASQQLLKTYAYFLQRSLTSPAIPEGILQNMSKRSFFDEILFADSQGIVRGIGTAKVDVAGRQYFADGMSGQSGMAVNMNPILFDQPIVSYYTPVHYENRIIGVLTGVYLAQKFLRETLDTSYFGRESQVYLCRRNGEVIASSSGIIPRESIFSFLAKRGEIDEGTMRSAEIAMAAGETASFNCAGDSSSDNLCVTGIPEFDYVLVQTFPNEITEVMVKQMNAAGVQLLLSLLVLFILAAAFILIRARMQKARLETRNRELKQISDGMDTLFSGRYLVGSFESGLYTYVGSASSSGEDVKAHGTYKDLFQTRHGEISNSSDQVDFEELFSPSNLFAQLQNRDTVNCAVRLRRDGKERWENIVGICLNRRDGKPVDFMVVRQDVTDMKLREIKAQEKIANMNRKERQYQIALTENALASYEFNVSSDELAQDVRQTVDGRQISLLHARGFTAPCKVSEFLSSWEPLVLPESREEYLKKVDIGYLRKRFYEGAKEVELDYWMQDSLGHEICLRQSFYMASDELTGDVMAMTVMRDITAQVVKQRSQTKALQDALMLAQHANEAKTTFLSNMSHDIRTPMNAIIGFSSIAASHLDNKNQVSDCLQKVLSASNHLLSLINDILDMSRIESGKMQLKEQACNIPEMMHNLVNIVQPQVKAKQMRFFMDTFEVVNEDVITDPLKLNQVFINLLGNAVKYTPAGGMISFRITQKPAFRHGYAEYIFEVADNGVGMSEEFVKHIFEPFTRETTTTQSGIQGTGLGMAITKNIIEMMNGHIEIESEPGVGSTFRVTFTLRIQDGTRSIGDIKALAGLRTLVVDDDLHVCDSVSKMLRKIGLTAEWTTSGREAVYRAQIASDENEPFDTFIVDWQMPDMNGLETAKRIREIVGEDKPIIILTAYEWGDIEEDAKKLGVTAFCAKPLFMSDLKNALLTSHNLKQKEENEESETEHFKNARILLVDDLEMNREVAEFILTESGFVVETAPDGTDAVEMVKNSPEGYYDAILMDVQMPTMNGYEATRAIRNLERKDVKSLPILAMTANALEEDRAQALQCGMNDHISKPIDIKKFFEVLEKYFAKK